MLAGDWVLRRPICALAMTAVVLLLTSAEIATSAPAARRHTGRHPAVHPATYSYHIHRVGRCADDDQLFADCFICGRLANDVRVYQGCCRRHDNVVNFCDRLLS